MNKLFMAAVLMAGAACAEPEADYVAGERSASLITPEVEQGAAALLGAATASNLLHAIKLNMTLYDADMATEDGRRRWHGRRHREIVDTNALCKVTVYTNAVDGSVWRYREPFKPRARTTLNPEAYTNGVLKTVWATLTPERQAVVAARYAARQGSAKTVTVNVTR